MAKKIKKPKATTKEKSYRFWNNGVEYFCNIVSPITIPDYKLKEIFDRTFIGKKDTSVLTKPMIFSSLNKDITYEVIPVKEYDNVR